MAIATRTNQIREVVKVELVPAVTLTLSLEEAGVLRTVCGKIGGDTSGPRGKMDEIANALQAADVPHVAMKTDSTLGAIYIN